MKSPSKSIAGNLNAFFGLTLDNIADLLLAVSLLSAVFDFPAKFAVTYMVPGTALGVVVGDMLFTWMGARLARRTGRDDVTAMPLGLDTPSTFGMVFFVLGPAFLHAKNDLGLVGDEAARHAWQVGMACIILSGILKLGCAVGAHTIRHLVPRAGLLGSLTSIALVLISFLPLLDVLLYPVVGMIALAVILTSLVARVRVPLGIPGALAALLAGSAIFYIMKATGTLGVAPEVPEIETAIRLIIPWPTLSWLGAMQEALGYLPVVIPFALATVVGGIDCTESAAVVGDDYHTGRIIGVDALATLVGGCCGGVIQTTPYIGHPAYKAMGGRLGYTFATALFVGGAGMLGYFSILYTVIPKAAIFPILIFVGLEISAQSFHATPNRHYPAVVFACVPAMAYLVMIFADNIMGQTGVTVDDLTAPLSHQLQTMRVLSAGFILTSLIWASALAAIVDRRLMTASIYLAIGAAFSLFGVIHSPLPGSPLVLPWAVEGLGPAAAGRTPYYMAAAYAATALLLAAWSWNVTPEEPDDAH